MLVKCVCSNCGHSYLSDDSAGDLACPRCDVANEGTRNPSDIPEAPLGSEPMFIDTMGDPLDADIGFGLTGGGRFDPQAPPPMFVTGERLLRGSVFGSVAGLSLGAILGAALAAVGFVVPAFAPLAVALVIGMTCRYGFGGRAAKQTRGRALLAVVVSCVVAECGFLTGGWVVERFTGSRAAQTRADLDEGLHGLVQQRARTKDAGTAIVLDQRIAEVERLRRRGDASLEDYLWTQQAQINQPLLAYMKLRATAGPVLRLGVDAEPSRLPPSVTLGLVGLELLLAVLLARRGVLAT